MAAPTILLLYTTPETLPGMALSGKARHLRAITRREDIKAPVESIDRSLGAIFRRDLTRPWRLLLDPISFFVAIYYSIVYTLLYMLFSIYPIVFQQKRGWNAGNGELPLLGVVIGACLGGIALFIHSTRIRRRGFDQQKTPQLPASPVPWLAVSCLL